MRFPKVNPKTAVWAAAILSLIGAGIYGQLSQGLGGDFTALLPKAMPAAASFKAVKSSSGVYLYAGMNADGQDLGYVTAATSQGYGGPMTVLVDWTLDGVITAVSVPVNHEGSEWWSSLLKSSYFKQYIGRSYSQPLE